ncbi:hypothetical protein NDU88_002738 [Pleurodeles waltl]|uniref:Uncharacterized protein n=1 Tax=Pleurodeles waltl TaxID=8319 RepID=A0AAV7PAK1_PLEWA|nr:hypothetical protein NDU88_002738 [Pleurodeles waltl]
MGLFYFQRSGPCAAVTHLAHRVSRHIALLTRGGQGILAVGDALLAPLSPPGEFQGSPPCSLRRFRPRGVPAAGPRRIHRPFSSPRAPGTPPTPAGGATPRGTPHLGSPAARQAGAPPVSLFPVRVDSWGDPPQGAAGAALSQRMGPGTANAPSASRRWPARRSPLPGIRRGRSAGGFPLAASSPLGRVSEDPLF